ncbi:hypothetical protein BZZ01_13825 [Nostocales cyanobacterium HT-58-2]|nr:hypothetical protein BZZ01_13825 [Nostocales cyanobacterium HT-58-2]
MKDLYIFVTTDRPDQYLNPIVHRIEQGTRRIIFIQVEDNRVEQVQLNLLQANVYNLLQNLSIGIYKYYVGKLRDKVIQLDTIYNIDEFAEMKAKYAFCLTDNISWSVDRIEYSKLRSYISALSRRKDVIIDVTSVSKVYIGDIFACSLLENIENLYTFELLFTPDYEKPWEILIYDLAKKKRYKYVNLVETEIFEQSRKSILIKTTPLLVSIIGTVLFVGVTLAATFVFGFSSIFIQVVSTIGTVLGIISFFLVYFPVRGK